MIGPSEKEGPWAEENWSGGIRDEWESGLEVWIIKEIGIQWQKENPEKNAGV
jgi:hypothetical protein